MGTTQSVHAGKRAIEFDGQEYLGFSMPVSDSAPPSWNAHPEPLGDTLSERAIGWMNDHISIQNNYDNNDQTAAAMQVAIWELETDFNG
ncbi:MAG TPA: hypothetical protein VMV81_07695, partial [Phycisphaerae bacterium]|nr:hypothetical protein [Phycisphaerae bacterium]